MMDFVVKGKRVHKSTECTRKEDALKIEKHAKEQLRKLAVLGKLQETTKTYEFLKLSEATERQYREVWIRQTSGEQSRNRLLHLAETYGNVTLDQIGKEYISKVRQGLLKEGKSVATVNRFLAHLRTVLHTSVDSWGYELHIPKFLLEKEQNGRRVVLTREQEQTLTAFFRSSKWKPRQYFYEHVGDLIEVLTNTGMRLSECLNGTYDRNFNLVERVIKLFPDETKSGKARSIPMSSLVYSILLARSTAFPIRPFPYHPWQVSDAFRMAKKALKYDDADLCLHSCRHTFASRLLEVGESIRTVQELLGHASITTTERYTHMSTNTLRAAIDKL